MGEKNGMKKIREAAKKSSTEKIKLGGFLFNASSKIKSTFFQKVVTLGGLDTCHVQLIIS